MANTDSINLEMGCKAYAILKKRQEEQKQELVKKEEQKQELVEEEQKQELVKKEEQNKN